MIDLTRKYSEEIDNGRRLSDIFNHLKLEVKELDVEVDCQMWYRQSAGEDGVVGEAVDVILCALDLIFKSAPGITNEEIEAYALKKLEKWKKHYSNSIDKQ